MIDIDTYIVSTVINDATMISLLGITATDNRIFAWYPTHDIVYNDVSPAVMVFRKGSGGRPGAYFSYPSQIPSINYFFRCLSIDQLVLGQVAERLLDLFDEKYNVTLTNFGIKKIGVIGNSDAPTEGDVGNPLYVKVVSFSFTNIVKRPY